MVKIQIIPWDSKHSDTYMYFISSFLQIIELDVNYEVQKKILSELEILYKVREKFLYD